jgi:hypothetical protein
MEVETTTRTLYFERPWGWGGETRVYQQVEVIKTTYHPSKLEKLAMQTIINKQTGLSGLPMAKKRQIVELLLIKTGRLPGSTTAIVDDCWHCDTPRAYLLALGRCLNPQCDNY